MALTRVDPGLQYFPSFARGVPLSRAQIYIGVPGLDPAVAINQYQAYIVQENGAQVAVPQPILTSAGGVPTYNGSPVQIAVEQTKYSLKILSSTGAQIYYQHDNSVLDFVDASNVSYLGGGSGAIKIDVETFLRKKVPSFMYGIPGDLTDDGQNHVRLKSAAKEAIAKGAVLEIYGKVLFSDTVDWDTTGVDYNNLDTNIPNGTAKYLPLVSFNSSAGLYAKCSAFSGLNKSCIIYRTQESKVCGLTIRMYNDGSFTYATMRNIKLLQVKTSDRTPIVFNSIGGILEPSGAVSIGAGTNIWLDDCMSPTVENNFIVYYTRYGVCRDNGTAMDPIAANPVRVSTSGSFIKNYFGGGWPNATSRNQCVSMNLGYGDTLVQNVFENNSKGRALYWDNDNNAFYNNWHEGTYDTALIGGGFGARWNGAVNLQSSPTSCAIEGLYTYTIPGSLAIGTPNPTALNNFDVLNNGFYFGGHLFGARVNAKNGVYTNGVIYQSNSITTDNNTSLITTLGGNGVSLVGTSTKNPFNTNAHIIKSKEAIDGAGVLILESSNATNGTVAFFGVAGAGVGYNAAACALGIFRSTTGRSINAAGTINASGADYAEYMRRKYVDDIINKGDIVGTDKDGLLVTNFDDAVRFFIKSTDPGMVGGDVWGREDVLGLGKPKYPKEPEKVFQENFQNDEDFKKALENYTKEKAIFDNQFSIYEKEKAIFDSALEEARRWVDRIAICGQVPLNTNGQKFKTGDYVLPEKRKDGKISWKAVDQKDLTMGQYLLSPGVVLSILKDGRPNVMVKPV
jgi:hypothetical protein